MLDLISSRVHADALDILVAAFENDHAVRCLYADTDAYRAHFAGFALALGGRAFDGGTVDVEQGAPRSGSHSGRKSMVRLSAPTWTRRFRLSVAWR